MAGRTVYRRAGSLRTALGLMAIPEDRVSRTSGSLKPILKRSKEPMEPPEREPSLSETVARMLDREKTFLTQVDDEEQGDSRAASDFDDSDDYEGDDYFDDDMSDKEFKRRRRRKKKTEYDVGEEFLFSEADEEEIRRRSKKKKITTDVVYAKACEKSKLTPCRVFMEQMASPGVNLKGMHLGPREIKPVAISMVKDRRIVTLDLSDNAMGPVGVMYIAEMMQANTYLLELDLSFTKSGHAGLGALAETLSSNNSIRILKLEGNHFEHTEAPYIASIITSCPKLQELHLAHNNLGASGGKIIAEALVTNEGLKDLDLQWNHLRRESAVALGKALAKNKSLRLLNVAWNGFGKEGCLSLSRSLPKNTTLRELNLTCNRIDYPSLSFLAHGLVENTGLETVVIGHNPLSAEGCKQLIKALTDSKISVLKELDMEDVPVDMDFMKLLKKYQNRKSVKVIHGYQMKIVTSAQSQGGDGKDLSKWDPVLVLFEYMRMDNLRLIDMFKSFDAKKRDKLSRADIKAGINTLKIPFTEHALDEIMEKVDTNKDRFIDLEEMMRASKDMSRYVNQRVLKARAKNREDQGLVALRDTLKNMIKKRKEAQEAAAKAMQERRKSLLDKVLANMKPKKKRRNTKEVLREAANVFLSLLKSKRVYPEKYEESDILETIDGELGTIAEETMPGLEAETVPGLEAETMPGVEAKTKPGLEATVAS